MADDDLIAMRKKIDAAMTTLLTYNPNSRKIESMKVLNKKKNIGKIFKIN
jgi:hypothetical protein